MMQPMNYLLESKNPLQAFSEGADFVRGLKNKEIQDQQTQWQHDDIIEQRDRKAQYEQEIQDLDFNDMGAMRGLIARYPELSKGVQTAYDALDAKQKEAALLDTSRLLSLMRAGKASDAVAMLDAQIDAYTNMGDEQKAAEAESMKKLIELSPEAALGTLSMGYAIMAPKDIVDNYKNLSDTYGSQDKLPDEINEIRSNNFDKNASSIKNVAQQISNAAIPQDPATFSLKVGQLYSASLITPEQYQYLMDGIKPDENNPDKVKTFLGNLANQSEAFAIANKPELKWVTTGGETKGVEYDPYTGEVTEKKNYTNTVSPDTVERVQSSERIATMQETTKRYNAEQERLLKQYKIAQDDKHVQQKLEWAQQQEEIKAKKGEFKTFGDKVYIVYPNGQARQAVDQNGNPIKATKPNPQRELKLQQDIDRVNKVKVLIPEARRLLKSAGTTGSKAGALRDAAAGSIGVSTKGAEITAQLQTIGGQLTSTMPRMEGPQSDKDVELYKQMAGDVANPNKPIRVRLAALDAIERINNKYEKSFKSQGGGSVNTTTTPPKKATVKTSDLF